MTRTADDLAKHIHIDEDTGTVWVDGVEFPWLIAEQGVTVDHLGTPNIDDGGHYLRVVHVPILVERVTVSDGDVAEGVSSGD